MDPILEFVVKSGIVALGAYLWIRDMNKREERVAKESADREARMGAEIEARQRELMELQRAGIQAQEHSAQAQQQQARAMRELADALSRLPCAEFLRK